MYVSKMVIFVLILYKMTEIIFTRHGQTEWNVARKMQGQLDSPLTEMGLLQARMLGAYLKDKSISAVYSSPLLRAQRTATIIRKEIGLENLELSPALKEINLSDLEGKSFSKASEEEPERMQAFSSHPSAFVPGPGGETFEEVQKRALGFILPLFDRHNGQRIIVVCHAVVLRLMMAYFESYTIDEYWKVHGFFFPCSITSVCRENGNYILLQRNSIEHSK